MRTFSQQLIFAFIIIFVSIGCNPTTTATKNVTLSTSTLQYSSNGSSITGTITVKNTATAQTVLSDFNASASGCTFSNIIVNSAKTLTIAASSSSQPTTISMSVSSGCSATSLTLSATSTTSGTKTVFSDSASIAAASTATTSSGTTSNIVTLVADSSSSAFTITNNSESRTVKIRAYDIRNAPVEGATIVLGYPASNVGTISIGSMLPTIEATTDAQGIATFTYTGPDDLVALYNSGARTDTFSFSDKYNTVRTTSLTVTYAPDTTVTPITQTGHTISFSNGTAKNTLDIESRSIFTLVIKDSNGKTLTDAQVLDLNITAVGTSMFNFIDKNNTEKATLHYTLKNNIVIPVQTYTTSGLTAITISASIKDDNGNRITLNDSVSLTVFSGLPTAISMSYAGSAQDHDKAKLTETWVMSLVDKYDNPINTTPTIYVGAMSGFVESNDTSGYLVKHGPEANLTTISTGGALLSGLTRDLSKIVINTGTKKNDDYAVTFGNGYSYQASGKWDINDSTASSLTLVDDYNSSVISTNLGYAVGHNYRQDKCRFGEEWLASVDSADGTYKVDANGHAYVKLSYDYYMFGKTIYMYTNVLGLVNSENRVLRLGETKKITLRGIPGSLEKFGAEPHPSDGYVVEVNATNVYRFTFQINGTTEFIRDSNISVYPDLSSGKAHINGTTTRLVEPSGGCTNTLSTGSKGLLVFDVNVTGGTDTDTLIIKDAGLKSEF